MAKYLKPQTPLQHQSGDYIYPITTADQVITAKGERLNANLISVDLNESVESDTNINLVNNKPKAGFIYPLASDVVPEGFLLCDGAEYLRAEYPELFATIGTVYGAGDGSTTFNVPNLQNNNVVNYIIATGKDTGVSVADIIVGAQALPLGVEYGGTGATNAATARANLEITPENIGAMCKMELLWENASPTSSFAGQTINLDLSRYTYVRILFGGMYVDIKVGKNGRYSSFWKPNNVVFAIRTIQTTSDSITFSECLTFWNNNISTVNTDMQDVFIPTEIYGIKGVYA